MSLGYKVISKVVYVVVYSELMFDSRVLLLALLVRYLQRSYLGDS